MRKLIAKVKFWFGAEEPIFDTKKYDVQYNTDKTFAYIFTKEKR